MPILHFALLKTETLSKHQMSIITTKCDSRQHVIVTNSDELLKSLPRLKQCASQPVIALLKSVMIHPINTRAQLFKASLA